MPDKKRYVEQMMRVLAPGEHGLPGVAPRMPLWAACTCLWGATGSGSGIAGLQGAACPWVLRRASRAAALQCRPAAVCLAAGGQPGHRHLVPAGGRAQRPPSLTRSGPTCSSCTTSGRTPSSCPRRSTAAWCRWGPPRLNCEATKNHLSEPASMSHATSVARRCWPARGSVSCACTGDMCRQHARGPAAWQVTWLAISL